MIAAGQRGMISRSLSINFSRGFVCGRRPTIRLQQQSARTQQGVRQVTDTVTDPIAPSRTERSSSICFRHSRIHAAEPAAMPGMPLRRHPSPRHTRGPNCRPGMNCPPHHPVAYRKPAALRACSHIHALPTQPRAPSLYGRRPCVAAQARGVTRRSRPATAAPAEVQ
jgi:hypothetical protein